MIMIIIIKNRLRRKENLEGKQEATTMADNGHNKTLKMNIKANLEALPLMACNEYDNELMI